MNKISRSYHVLELQEILIIFREILTTTKMYHDTFS